ncbi:RNA polymerase sigma factor [Niallia sp. 03190]|uniref:RNA polymerase sigma factor n=1 Tax=Niallia sp. 03190 TaxID=3458061 RepID=UPI0040440497
MESQTDISKIFPLFYQRLFQISYSITRDRHLAEDVVQETFIKAMKKMGSIEDEKKIGAWLSVTATRTAIDFVRKERKKQGIVMEIDIINAFGKTQKQHVEDKVEADLFFDRINAAIGRMNKDYQKVFLLKIKQGLKENEIAEILGIKHCTVKTRIYRARKQLKILFLNEVNV